MDWKLELVPIPVSDVDRAKAFYAEKVGFNVDLDVNADNDRRVSDEMRVVQLTPPGSACSIVFGTGIVETPPGSVQGLHLVVSDINAARAELVERGVEVGEVRDLGGSCTPPSAIRTGTAGPCSSCLISQARPRRRGDQRASALVG
jgi:catechol 2,3-dioxygenase-like lactoylglutathione lyase family enzyme